MTKNLNIMEERELQNQFRNGLIGLAVNVPKITFPNFLLGMKEVSEKKDFDLFYKNTLNMGKYLFLNMGIGVIFNRFYTKSKFVPRLMVFRLPVRLSLLLLPNLPLLGFY